MIRSRETYEPTIWLDEIVIEQPRDAYAWMERIARTIGETPEAWTPELGRLSRDARYAIWTWEPAPSFLARRAAHDAIDDYRRAASLACTKARQRRRDVAAKGKP